MSSAANSKARRAIEAAIYQRLIFPPEGLRNEVNGNVFIKITVTPAGNVPQVSILNELFGPFDLAVVKAARQLRFQPRPVKEGAVSFVVGISWEKAVDLLPTVPSSPLPAKHSRAAPRR